MDQAFRPYEAKARTSRPVVRRGGRIAPPNSCRIRARALGSFRDGDGHVVDPKKSWASICKAAGISGLRIHDLRHSYASMLVNAGLSLPTIGAMLGHTQVSTTARYSHLVDGTLRTAAEHVGQMVDAARKRAPAVVPFPVDNSKARR